jgi:hypothetical protein
VLAALIERTGAGGFDGFRQKVASSEWRKAVVYLVDEDWLQLDFVDRLREDAKDDAKADIAAVGDSPVPGDTAKQAKDRKKEALNKAKMARRDVVFENALLLMLQALLYTDYHDSIRSGDSGRLERSANLGRKLYVGSNSTVRHERGEMSQSVTASGHSGRCRRSLRRRSGRMAT